MADYISREAAIKAAKCHYPKANEMIAGITLVPAADVVEVVRCKDCTYFNHIKCQEERAGLCEHFDTYMYISDYCSDGIRGATMADYISREVKDG